MTFLTRMSLNPGRRQTRAILGSPQAMHASVLTGFPPEQPPEGRVLWRVDHGPAGRVVLYVCSPSRPDLTHLVEQAGWPTTGVTWETREYGPLLDRLEAGQQWAFRLTANPVHRVRDPQSRVRGSVRAHVTAQQQAAWLLDRALDHGFEVLNTGDESPCLSVRDRRTLSFRRRGATVTVVTATFEGVLRVKAPDVLTATLTGGMGRAKAYGCGLMTLAR